MCCYFVDMLFVFLSAKTKIKKRKNIFLICLCFIMVLFFFLKDIKYCIIHAVVFFFFFTLDLFHTIDLHMP